MARRKNTKRIDPRYFLNETVNRGEELEEANWADEPEADKPWSYKPSSAGGYSAQVDREKPAARKKGRGKPTRPEPGESDEEFFQRQADWVNKRLGKLEETELDEGCPHAEEGGAAIDISAPGTEVHVDDISQLSPEEAFAAGMAAAREAIDQVMGAPDGPPPEGGFSGNGPFGAPIAEEE